MKITMEFELPQEQDQYMECQCGPTYRAVLHDLDQWLRGRLKYAAQEELDDDQHEALSDVRIKLHDLAADHGVTIYD